MWEEEREERAMGHMVVERRCEGSNNKKEGCALKEMCKSVTEVYKARYKNMKNGAKKVVMKQ